MSEQRRTERAQIDILLNKYVGGVPYTARARDISPGGLGLARLLEPEHAGKLTNGTEFDSSYRRNQPLKFQLDKVIPCWTEGVQQMKVGGKARIVCPAKVGYGETGQPRAGIPGGSTLDFSVELLDAKAPAPPPVPTPGGTPGFTPPPTGK